MSLVEKIHVSDLSCVDISHIKIYNINIKISLYYVQKKEQNDY